MDTGKLVTMLLIAVVELNSLIQAAKSREAALYLQGCRDMSLALVKALQQASPLAVDLFNSPVVVKEM